MSAPGSARPDRVRVGWDDLAYGALAWTGSSKHQTLESWVRSMKDLAESGLVHGQDDGYLEGVRDAANHWLEKRVITLMQ